MKDPAETNGPRGDGSQTLARESRFGQLTTVAVSVAALALGDWLGSVDVTPLPDWMEQSVVVALAACAGLIVAWGTKNRKDFVGKG